MYLVKNTLLFDETKVDVQGLVGEMIVREGKLERLSDFTGHYKVTEKALQQVKQVLREQLGDNHYFRVDHFDNAREVQRVVQMPDSCWCD